MVLALKSKQSQRLVSILKSKKIQRLVLAVGLAALLTTVFLQSGSRVSHNNLLDRDFIRKTLHKPDGASRYDRLFAAILDLKPNFEPLEQYHNDQKVKQKFASDMDFAFSKEYLSGVLQVTQEQIDDLHMKHENFKYLVEHHADQLLSPGKSAGRGIVYVGGGKFSWLDVISIQQLRRSGSTLPVEVFIPTEEEYEAELCEFILPKLGGRCMQLAELIPQQTLQGFQITGFQYKSLALLVSHFDEILFLDSDNVPTSNVDHLFKAEPFTSTQAVFWPDSWARTTHPQLYEIMGLEVNERRKVRGNDLTNLDPATSHFHDFQGTLGNPSTETGVFMLNKRTHRKTLLLSLYYNIYGPGYYYPLMCQGGAGEGDKETFIFAGFVLKEPTYSVQKLAWWIGFHDDDEFHAKALGQHDPVSDFKRSKLVKVPEDKKPDVDLGFMHMGYPKLFPEMLMGEVLYGEGNQQHRRLYQDLTRKLGYDFEFTMWKIMAQSLCDVSDMGAKFPLTHVPGIENIPMVARDLEYFKGKDMAKTCRFLVEHTNWLMENSN